MSSKPSKHKVFVVAGGLTAVAAVGAVVFGYMAIRRRSQAPSLLPDAVRVVARAEGRSAAELEKTVTEPLESALAAVPQLRSMRSVSTEGEASVECFFAPGHDLAAASEDMRARLQASGLANDISLALVREPGSKRELIRYEIAHDKLAPLELRRLHDTGLRESILALPGVEGMTVCGAGEPEVRVGLDPMRMAAFNLQPSTVTSGISQFLAASSAGGESSEGLRNIALPDAAGRPIKLADVATVRIAAAPHPCACVVGDRPAYCVSVFGPETQAGVVAAGVSTHLRTWAAQAPSGVDVHASADDRESTVLRFGVWTAGELRANPEAETARAIAKAIVTGAGMRVRVRVGRAEGAVASAFEPNGEIEVRLPGMTSPSPDRMEQEIDQAVERAVPSVRLSPLGNGVEPALDAHVRGPDIAELSRLAQELRAKASAFPGTREAMVTGLGQRTGFDIRLDRERAAALGVSPADVTWLAALALEGFIVGPIAPGANQPNVRVELAEVGRTLPEVLSLRLRSNSAVSVPISEVADVRMGASVDPIVREDRQRAVVVRMWGPAEDAGEWASELRSSLTRQSLPAGYVIEWRGGSE